jgi:hypothetical protein
MEPIPEDVHILQEFDKDLLVVDNEGKPLATGRHVYIEGEKQSILNWLNQFDGFFVSVGSPIMQNFKAMHVSDNALEQGDE